jgi:hypothetical protein
MGGGISHAAGHTLHAGAACQEIAGPIDAQTFPGSALALAGTGAAAFVQAGGDSNALIDAQACVRYVADSREGLRKRAANDTSH